MGKVKFDNNKNKSNKKVEFLEKNFQNSTFFLFALTSFWKKLAGLKGFVYFVSIVINLTLPIIWQNVISLKNTFKNIKNKMNFENFLGKVKIVSFAA